MPLAPHLLVPLTRRFQVSLVQIADRTVPRVQRAWRDLDSYNETDIPDFERSVQPALDAAKFASVRAAVGYYSLATGIRPPPITAADVAVTADLREPFISTWLALKNGEPIAAAIDAGEGRTDAVARNLITSSSIQTGDVVVNAAGLRVVGWERIPDDNACPWCIEVSGQTYNTAESADFGHDRCGCTAQPILA